MPIEKYNFGEKDLKNYLDAIVFHHTMDWNRPIFSPNDIMEIMSKINDSKNKKEEQ